MESAIWLVNQPECGVATCLFRVFRLTFCMNITYPAHLSLVLITVMLYGREYGLRSSCFCIYLHSLYMSFFLEPNILHMAIMSGITQEVQ
jgi:hypothetical protein